MMAAPMLCTGRVMHERLLYAKVSTDTLRPMSPCVQPRDFLSPPAKRLCTFLGRTINLLQLRYQRRKILIRPLPQIEREILRRVMQRDRRGRTAWV